MDVREYFKNKLSQPMSEDYEDLLTGKEVMDIAQECVDEALKQVKNHVVLDNVNDCCKQIDNLELTNNWGVRRCKKCGNLVDTSGR